MSTLEKGHRILAGAPEVLAQAVSDGEVGGSYGERARIALLELIMNHDPKALSNRIPAAYAHFVVNHPVAVLATLLTLGIAGTWAASRLTINSNQLDLISQDLPEVKAVKRIINMVGGTGHLMIALRSEDADELKATSDDLAAMLRADKENVRNVAYKTPVEFVQENMVLFVKTEDLLEVKKRVTRYLKSEIRRNNPFFIELRKSEPAKLEIQDIVDKYSSVGKKSIRDDYYISPDRKMLLLIVKPMWDSNDLGKTKALVEKLRQDFAAYSEKNSRGVKLLEDYDLSPKTGGIAYGFTGSYKTNVDDSFAMAESLGPVTGLAFLGILVITLIFFRKIWPSLIVIFGTVLGTILTMGLTYVTVGQLNMVTSILGGILMGFGVDYGIHFTYRTRIELGLGKPYDIAIRDALINAGRPACIAAVVTGGSFMVLMVSEFRGFSQFGFLAGTGTMIIGLTLFSFCPAMLALLGKRWPSLPERIVGKMNPMIKNKQGGEVRIPHPGRILVVCSVVVCLLSLAALGVRFNYNTRALMPENQPSVKLQDEISARFKISSDPTAVYTKDLVEAKEVYDELTNNAAKYPTIDQVVSIYTFVPPLETAQKNVEILAQWKEELKDFDPSLLPEEVLKKKPLFDKILEAKPFGVDGVPDMYAAQFRHLETADAENHGYLTYIYPRVDLWDGKQMLEFADQTSVITTASGHEYRSAGLPILFAKLARIVLWDGKVTVLLAAIWILLMHYLDFRSVKLAAASVIPLGIGLLMMLGLMSITDHRLNFMNIIILPILLGFGVSHGLYLLHRFLEGISPVVALRSVGAAVASSTLTAIAGFGSLFVASHNGLRSMGYAACLGLTTTLVVSFTVLAAVLELIHDQRLKEGVGTVHGSEKDTSEMRPVERSGEHGGHAKTGSKSDSVETGA